MQNLDFDYQIDDFMLYCRTQQLREKSMQSYEQTLRLFERWCVEQFQINKVDAVTEAVIRRYVDDLIARGKYSFYVDDIRLMSLINFPYITPLSKAKNILSLCIYIQFFIFGRCFYLRFLDKKIDFSLVSNIDTFSFLCAESDLREKSFYFCAHIIPHPFRFVNQRTKKGDFPIF